MAPAGRRGSLGRGARPRILEAARTLFTRQGVNATSINELRAEARVSKRTLYQQFASKDDLVLAYLDERSERTGCDPGPASRARSWACAARPAPRAVQLTLADAPKPYPSDPFVAAAAEFPDPEHPCTAQPPQPF